MKTIPYIRKNQLGKLRNAVKNNIELYKSEEPHDWNAFFGNEQFIRSSSIPVSEDIGSHIQMPENKDLKDAENSIIIYEALKDLTPQQATDERVWAYFTHFELWEYVQHRWPLKENAREEAAVRYIQAHYFLSGVRGFFRDNAVSRLWWMGWVASHCHHFNAEKTLEILLYQSDVRANLLERASFGMSKEIFSAVMKWLGKSYDGEKVLFQRETFRQLMKHLNRKGGRIMLNALKPKQLSDLIEKTLKDDLGLNLKNL